MHLKHAVFGLCCLILLGTPALAQAQDKPLEMLTFEINRVITQQGLKDMMNLTMRLKEAGASYQKDLTFPAAAKLGDDAEARRILIGVYQFDALYAAAFGKKNDVSAFLNAQNEQIMKLNLKGRVDVSAVFPPELNWMLREPDKVDFDDIVAAYSDNVSRYETTSADPAGLDVIADSLYGFVVESLYVTGQSILQAGSDPQMMRVINGMGPALNTLAELYGEMELRDDYRELMDPAQILSQGARWGWVRELANLLRQRGGTLSGNELHAIAAFAVEQRKNLMTAD